MAKELGVLVCILMMAMDIVAGILGIEAEIAQNKAKHLKLWNFECRDMSHQAFKLGLAAALLLALAHILANLIGGCIYLQSRENFAKKSSANKQLAVGGCIYSQSRENFAKKSSANKQLAVICLIFSWIVAAVALSMLIIGTLANSRSRKSCGLSHHRVFYIGGILCFVHGLLIVAYYVSAKAAEKEDKLAPERTLPA